MIVWPWAEAHGRTLKPVLLIPSLEIEKARLKSRLPPKVRATSGARFSDIGDDLQVRSR